jgi:hypothetical protein
MLNGAEGSLISGNYQNQWKWSKLPRFKIAAILAVLAILAIFL